MILRLSPLHRTDRYACNSFLQLLNTFASRAVGRIWADFQQSLESRRRGADNFNPPDAPVSYPFLWGTDQSDYVQWVGNAGNSNIGRLGRNTGEVLGVFAHINMTHRHWYTIGYPSSAESLKQIEVEQQIRNLQSPLWPDILPAVDDVRAGRGADLYKQQCAGCHNIVDRTDVKRNVVAWMERLDTIQTDPKTARNIVSRTGKTGILEGRKIGVLFGKKFDATSSVNDIVTHEVIGMLLHRGGDDILDELISFFEGRGLGNSKKQGNYDKDQPLLAYKGRSLCGVWATAPYLHNGSVPSLWQLLTKPADRIKTFYVGSREFDPKEVGQEYRAPSPGSAVFETHDKDGEPIPGNSNAGHLYGTDLTDAQKWDLVEYMKTAMSVN